MIRHRLLAVAMLGLAACSQVAQAATYEMFRDPGCGCCLAWARHVDEAVEEAVTVTDSADMAGVKDRLGVPANLRSCHTMVVDGYVIEGHVPAADIERLLAERPEGVTGLAVPGMPVGSPGMEMGGRVQPYQVIAFGPAGSAVFTSYP